jgi:ATP-dependent Clp protease protease subunit
MNNLYIDDFIGSDMFGDGITNKGVREILDTMDGDINVHISSPGGSVFEGHDIFNTLKDYDKGSIQVIVGSLAGSIASVIAYAGEGLPMVRDNSSMFIHDPSTIVMGTAAEMRQTADQLDTIKATIMTAYPSNGMDYSDLMEKETWFTAQQAIDSGLALPYEKGQVINKANSKFHGLSYQDLMQTFKDSVKPVIEPIIENTLPNLEARKRFLEIQSDDC